METTNRMRRLALTSAFALAALAGAGAVFAQAYPAKPVRVIVPTGPGSISDTFTRAIAQQLSIAMGQTFVVENRVGANGIVGAEAVAKSPPDGYTILVGNFSTHAANSALYQKLPYDPVRDFTAIAKVGDVPYVLVINPAIKAQTFQELVALGKAQPGKLTYASGSSPSIVAMEAIKRQAGVDILHVPYKTVPQAIPDVTTGQVDMIAADMGTALPQIKAGKLRALANIAGRRTPLLPDVPAISDFGVQNLDVVGFFSWYAPAGTPKEIVDRLAGALRPVMLGADLREKMAIAGVETTFTTPAELDKFTREQLTYWGRLIREAGIKPE